MGARLRRVGPEAGLLVASVAGLGAGAVAMLVGATPAARTAWSVTTAVAIVPAVAWVALAFRQHRVGVDIIAVVALAGTLAVDEPLAGAVIAVMLGTGRVLESHASRRATRELTALVSRAPRVVHRYDGATLVTEPLDVVRPGDRLLVRSGEVVPVDGLVGSLGAVLDESALTGEAVPIERRVGDAVRSGVVNAGGPFDLLATTTATDSTYAGIVRLVRSAQAQSAPFVRLADRWALVFVPLTFVVAGLAWALSGDAVRAVAVLVVATPCPLILAAPIAISSGLSLTARRGVIVKGGASLEQLAGADVLLMDKTGTVTAGRPTVSGVVAPGHIPASEVLRLAASLDQVSPHVLAAAIVRAAVDQGLHLVMPHDVSDVAGQGIRGTVAGRAVAVGKGGWISGRPAPWTRTVRRQAELDGSLTVFVAVDGDPAGAVLLEDPIRPDSARTMAQLRGAGIRKLVMLTGDRADVAETVGAVIGVDAVLAERTPAEKVEAVRVARRGGRTVMVGDGINDAPALAAADVGVALGARGATASSEAADLVLTGERLDRLADAVVIARRTNRIAMQSVLAGMAMSLVAMGVAGVGYLRPTFGAVVQEAIDVAVIFNALRALLDRSPSPRLVGDDAALSRRFSDEHRALRPRLDVIRTVADQIGTLPGGQAVERARSVHRFLVEDLMPHEEAEESELYPVMNRVLGGSDPTATMSRAHTEIARLTRRLGRLLDEIDGEPDPFDERELRSVLYGLDAVLRLHFAQEDEGYLSLAEDPPLGAAVP